MSAIELDEHEMDRVHAYWRGWEQRAPQPGFVSIVRLGADRFVTAPTELRAHVESADPVTPEELVLALRDHRVVRSGEARLAYTDGACFRSHASTRVARITFDDARIARLRRAADPVEWGESMSHDDYVGVAGIVERAQLVAIAAHQVWGDTLAHVAVFTASTARSRGLATEVASATVDQAMTAGLVPQWRVRLGNDASWRVAQKLGFVEAGRQIHASLRVDG